MPFNKRFRIIAGLVVAAVGVCAILILNRPESASSVQSTDDAYVRADLTVIVPQVSGAITHVAVADHQAVQAGDLLIEIDPREFRIAVDAAKADIASAQASILALQAQIHRQNSLIAQARAAVAASQAQLKLAENERRRYANLAKDGSGTVQALQQAQAQWEVQRAARERDVAAMHSAEQQTAILQAELAKAQAALETAKARFAQAELNLSYTHVKAPITGVVAQRRARDGGYARAGEPLLTLVPMQSLYIEANYRETQLAKVRAGQPVEVEVDALPGVRLHGHVQSVGPASEISFSAVPAHNATGNFTKIVQRLPVRIVLDGGQDALQQLRVGMSVHPSIDTSRNPAPSSKDDNVVVSAS